MVKFDAAHQAVHFPPDRRFRLWIRPSIFWTLGTLVLALLAAAWIQSLIFGLPPIVLQDHPTLGAPQGFPLWLRVCHFLNFAFVTLLIRSGLSILMDHPRLYFNNHCTPDSEWIRLTPIIVPRDRLWTAKDDARYISPIVGTPGYRHTIGIARVWHFMTVHGFILTGVVFYIMLFISGQWQRVVPTSFGIFGQAWAFWVHYATFHMPPEPNGFYAYNPLQLLAYGGTIFILGPLAILSGLAMSPAVVNRFPDYPRIFGGRQAARSIHFLTMVSFAVFILIHVSLVAITGFTRNLNHITLGIDDVTTRGLVLGLAEIGFVVLIWVIAHYLSWHKPRQLQHALKVVTYPMQLLTLNRFIPQEKYTKKDISPYFWPNGKVPVRDDWKLFVETDFKDFKLKVGGLVENPSEFSLEELAHFGNGDQITMHHCIQGWSGIAEWSGIPLREIIDRVRPKPEAKTVVFYSFGEALYGGPYYDTQSMENALKPQAMLATHMNGEPLPPVYGAPLRLRVENQLGYKMVKWIERIEFVESEKLVGKGEGGKNEDDEYFDLLPNI